MYMKRNFCIVKFEILNLITSFFPRKKILSTSCKIKNKLIKLGKLKYSIIESGEKFFSAKHCTKRESIYSFCTLSWLVILQMYMFYGNLYHHRTVKKQVYRYIKYSCFSINFLLFSFSLCSPYLSILKWRGEIQTVNTLYLRGDRHFFFQGQKGHSHVNSFTSSSWNARDMQISLITGSGGITQMAPSSPFFSSYFCLPFFSYPSNTLSKRVILFPPFTRVEYSFSSSYSRFSSFVDSRLYHFLRPNKQQLVKHFFYNSIYLFKINFFKTNLFKTNLFN